MSFTQWNESSRRKTGLALSALFLAVAPFACGDVLIQTATTGSASTATASGSATTGTGGHPSSSITGSSATTTKSAASTSSATASETSSTGPMCQPDDSTCHPQLLCGTHVYQCGNTWDDDQDGRIDMDDPECTGPCDNSEDSFYSNNPGQAAPCKVDCYFGTNANQGHDCFWDHACDSHETAANNYAPESNNGTQCAYNPAKIVNPPGRTCAELQAAQSPACINYCLPLTPNGCDCFGCCQIWDQNNMKHQVWLGSTNPAGAHCSMDTLDDPTMCQPCDIVPSCFNPADKPCQLGIGKTTLDPLMCPGGQECESGHAQCGLGNQGPCPPGEFCKTGCCYPVPLN